MKRFADWIFSFFCRPEYYDDIRGDLEELRLRRMGDSSESKADFMYLIAVIMLLRPSLIKRTDFFVITNHLFMIKHYAISALRSFARYKTYSAINVFGLTLGVAAAILIYSYVSHEISYDKHYAQKENIYRVTNHFKFGKRHGSGITGSGLLAPLLEEDIPEVALAGRSHYFGLASIQSAEKKFNQYGVYYGDPQLTQILEYEYLSGNAQAALNEPNSIVLSKSIAEKIFGDPAEAFGSTISVNQLDMQITGVIRDVPKTSHFAPSALVSMSTMGKFSWERVGHVTYVLLADQSSPKAIDIKMADMVEKRELNNPEKENYISFELFPVTGIHLSSDPDQEGRGNKRIVYTFSLIAIFILLIACINYMNLATARASKRAKEIGVRKVVGAVRRQISFQFLTESIFLAFISVLLGTLIASLLQTDFNQLAGIPTDYQFFNLNLCLVLLGLGTVIGVLSGSYPAIILSSFKPVSVIKGIYAAKGNKNLRRALVAFQFTVSIILIFATMVVYDQLDYIHSKDLGYNKEAVYVLRLGKADTSGVLKQQLLQHRNIQTVATTNVMPATGDSGATFNIQNENGENSKDIVSMASVDNDYLGLMDMELVEGKFFADENGTNENSIIVNETLVRKYGWNEPIGKQIFMGSEEEEMQFTIDGVVRDFNMLSLYEQVKPFAFFRLPLFSWGPKYLFVKLRTNDIPETLTFIRDRFEAFDPEHLYNGRFLDTHLESIYRKEQKQARIFLGFSGLAIAIACLGLFGLTAYTLERRMKEISIRKILGARLSDIVRLVSIEFIIIIVVSGIIAIPVAYYYMQDWLNNFSYHIELDLFTALLSALIVLGIALTTISLLTLRTARSNPVDALQCE